MSEQPPDSPPPPRKRLGWLRREGIDLGDAVVQFIAVLLGVLFALLISQWNDHRQQQAKAQAAMRQQQATVNEAMHAIRVELAANRAALHDSVVQLYAAAKRMASAAPKNRKQPPRPCAMWSGFGGGTGIFVDITDAAYKAAIATQAMAHMSFRQAHSVAEVYGGQHLVEASSGIMRNKLLGGPQTLQVCIGSMEDIGINEQSLSNAYTVFIGPDKTKWPAPPFSIRGLTTK